MLLSATSYRGCGPARKIEIDLFAREMKDAVASY